MVQNRAQKFDSLSQKNGAMEATNKNIKKILVKMIDTYKDWHEYLSFAPNYEGPYVVKKAFFGGALILADIDGHDFNMPTNSDAVIWYFA